MRRCGEQERRLSLGVGVAGEREEDEKEGEAESSAEPRTGRNVTNDAPPSRVSSAATLAGRPDAAWLPGRAGSLQGPRAKH